MLVSYAYKGNNIKIKVTVIHYSLLRKNQLKNYKMYRMIILISLFTHLVLCQSDGNPHVSTK